MSNTEIGFPSIDDHENRDSTAHCLPQYSATNSGRFTPSHWTPSLLQGDLKNPAAVSPCCHFHPFRSQNIALMVGQSLKRNI